MARARYGDVIFVDRGFYRHFGVYCGDGKVVHYDKADSGCFDGIVVGTSLKNFLAGTAEYGIYEIEEPSILKDFLLHVLMRGPILGIPLAVANLLLKMIKNGDFKVYTPDETVRRARSCIGQSAYNLLTNNCEHFALWCKTGIKRSEQAEALLSCIDPLVATIFA